MKRNCTIYVEFMTGEGKWVLAKRYIRLGKKEFFKNIQNTVMLGSGESLREVISKPLASEFLADLFGSPLYDSESLNARGFPKDPSEGLRQVIDMSVHPDQECSVTHFTVAELIAFISMKRLAWKNRLRDNIYFFIISYLTGNHALKDERMKGNIDDVLNDAMIDLSDIIEVEQVLHYSQFALECSSVALEHEQRITLVVENEVV